MGHSIESATGVFAETYRHGQGVALGMVGAAHIARTYFGCDDTILTRHEDILKKYDLPVYIDTKAIHFEPQQLLQDCLRNIRKDKKRKSNRLRFILPVEIGQSAIYNDVKEEMIEQAFRYLIR
jgi:3-dehydroquinate synthase